MPPTTEQTPGEPDDLPLLSHPGVASLVAVRPAPLTPPSPVWRLPTCTPQGLEKYLMTKLYDRTFGPQTPAEVAAEEVLAARLAGLQFVGPPALELPASLANDPAVASAAVELIKMNNYKV